MMSDMPMLRARRGDRPQYKPLMVKARLNVLRRWNRNGGARPPFVGSSFRADRWRRPGNDGAYYSAASLTSGAAARISASTWASNLAKFFWNIATSARAVLSNSALSFQVLIGSRIWGSTPGSEVGTANPK